MEILVNRKLICTVKLIEQSSNTCIVMCISSINKSATGQFATLRRLADGDLMKLHETVRHLFYDVIRFVQLLKYALLNTNQNICSSSLFNPSLGMGSKTTPEHPYIWSLEVKAGYDGFHFLWELHYMGLLNFPIRRIFYFIVEKKLFNIYTIKGVGSFSTPRLNTCTILATERQECIQCYCEGTLGLVFLSIAGMLGLEAWPRPRGQKTWPRPRPRGLWPRPRPRGVRPRPRPRGFWPRASRPLEACSRNGTECDWK